MKNNLKDGQKILILKKSLFQINDCIVFDHNGERFVKRIVAAPGNILEIRKDTVFINDIALTEKKGILKKTNFIVDSYDPIIYKYYFRSWSLRNFGKLQIPKMGLKIYFNQDNIELYGSVLKNENDLNIKDTISKFKNKEYLFKKNYYFVLGDNRLNSIDSRHFGPISSEQIFGKVICLF